MLKPEINITESATLKINSLAAEKIKRGETIFNLSAGEAHLEPHPAIVKAVENAIREGKTLYPPVRGIPELITAAVSWMKSDYHASYLNQECLVTAGGKVAIFYLLQTFLKQSDEVIIFSPYWVSYPTLITMFGGKPVVIETKPEAKWQISIKLLETKVNKKTKCIIINNGGNPSGAVYPAATLKRIIKIARRHNLLVISDEVYSGLTYDGKFYSLAQMHKEYENISVVQSASKNFALTGLRVGFVFAGEHIIKPLSMLQSQSTSAAASISQYAVLGAMQNSTKITAQINKAVKRRRDLFFSELKAKLGITFAKPPAGLYAFLPVKLFGKYSDSEQFCAEILEKANVASVPGSSFGRHDFVRFSFGVKEEVIKNAIKAMAKLALKTFI